MSMISKIESSGCGVTSHNLPSCVALEDVKEFDSLMNLHAYNMNIYIGGYLVMLWVVIDFTCIVSSVDGRNILVCIRLFEDAKSKIYL